ncbi:MAG: glycosyltransferase family 1 protein [Synechococcus sp. TMED20]|nr:MAG: glycosyltransferase family 1 protein [Synechococcus sp. TMED20]
MADVILLSTADWDHPLWTNKQHLAVSLADAGHRVLYIDSLGVRAARVGRSDAKRIMRRLRRCLSPLRQVRQRVWVLSPLVMPGQVSGFKGRLNRWSLNLALFWADCCLDLRTPLLWTFNPNTRFYLKLGRFHSTVYHCVDRIQAQPGMPVAELESAEQDLCGAVNAVFTTAPQLQEALSPLNAGTHLFGNVADASHFAQARSGALSRPSDLPSIDGPCLIFIGAIDAYKLDLPLLEALAAGNPQWTFILIGPVGETDPSTDASVLIAHHNVHWLGPKPYSELPAYLAAADVALLPLQLNDYTRHMYPMKFFEYLAAGCPVVSTAIPSLLDQADVACLCLPDVEPFQAAIAALLKGDGPPLERRLARAAQFTYDSRTALMLDCLGAHGLMPSDPAPPQAMPYHRVRRQLRAGWFAESLSLLVVQGLERLGVSGLSQHCLDGLLTRCPDRVVFLAARARQAFAAGNHSTGRQLIERIWLLDGEAELLHQLLFRRGSRPGDRTDQLAMFDALAASSVLPLHFAGYCRVVRTYRSIDAKDQATLQRCCRALARIIEQLEQDPNTYRCLKPNRENRAKLLISAHLTRLRGLMALHDHAGLDQAARELGSCAERYDPFAIDRTTATRMTRNMMRCLAIAALMAWHASDSQRMNAVLAQAERLRTACYADRFDSMSQRTQEDHRGFADQMLERLRCCRWSTDPSAMDPSATDLSATVPSAEAFVEPLLLVYFPVLRPDRAEKAWRFLTALTGQAAA